MAFVKATRKQAKLRMALCGVSGSGKTTGALTIAKGMGMKKIAVIDTENGRSSFYSDKFDFDVDVMVAPYSPANYILKIKEAEKLGYEIIIIDSLSHAWTGTGGALEMHDKVTASSKSGNSYTAWKDITAEQNRLIDAVVQSKCHVICCMRAKTQYEILADESGRMKPVKIGLAPIQRKEIDFEFDLFLDLSHENHLYSSSKDITGMFEGTHDVITEETGAKLLEWLNKGESVDETKDKHLEKINSSKSLNDLKAKYISAHNDLILHPDLLTQVTEAKNKKKDELSDLQIETAMEAA